MVTHTELKQQLEQLQSVVELMRFFEIDCDSQFLELHSNELLKRFNGGVIIRKPDDWFSYRRCLKNAYCRIQRSLLPKGGRSACRGCTSCERR
ncbi:nitrogen fixation protein NifW [Psychromonas sp.]|nr:nitrogen fixation protein NifW [Psychromonas sp.]